MHIDKLKNCIRFDYKSGILTGHQVKAIKERFLEKLMAYLNIANDCKTVEMLCYVSIKQ